MPSSNRVKNIQYWLRQQVRRLERLWHITYQPQTTEDNGISMQEWNTIWTFHKANLLAMKCLINAMNGLNHTCAAKANEITPMDALYHNFHAEDPWDAVDLKVPPWKSKEFRSYPFVDSALSFIQSIDISATDFPTRDVCLYRNHNLHVCSSFRPTYYEYFMHPAASLLKSIRRVLIIGHGAAFLLQEAMKYSSTLDLLVLIEPDQTMAFMVHRHFGVDLHLNDPRVEWCFGDVEETLSMMPEQYWSSFDLVLLDMDKSDFSSFSCKEKKLSDLVHEGGIFVSHKNHVVEMGNDFAFTSCLIHQSTKRSKQIYTLGSHSVDFLHAKSMDHEIKTLIYEPSLMSSHRLSLLRDFTNLASLASPVVSEGKEFIQTNSTHVVLNLVEIINVTTSLEEIISSLQEALILHDFTLHTIIQFSTTEAIVLKMEEGYMIARRKVSMDYLGLDIYLWKKQSQLSELKAAIVERLGTATSNFRLAPFGIKSAVSRVSDENHRNKVPTYPLEPLNHSIIEKFLEAVEKIFVQSPVKALLVCESVNDCPSREWIKDLYFVGSLFELEMCSTRSQDDEGQRMIACDRHIRDWIERTLQSIGILIDVIFVDGGLSSRSLQVLDGILNVDSRSRQSWIADSNLLLALPTYLDFSSEDNSFTDWFHQRSGLPDGVNANFVVFDNYGRRLSQIRLVSSMGMGDTRRRMQELESMVDEELNKVDLRVQLQRLRGASIRPRDLLPVRRFGHEDYQVTSVDITSPTIQVGVQDFTRVQGATNRTEIVAAIRMALESTIRQEVKMRVTDDKEPANVFVFEFDSGNLVIVLFENSAMDLNMFYECSEVDCQETDEIIDDFFDRMFQEHSAWQPLSVNTMTRGSKRS